MEEFAATSHQFLAHLDAVVDSILSHLLIIGLDGFQVGSNLVWDVSLAELDGLLESLIAEDGHETWNNSSGDTDSSAILHPI